MKHGNKNCKCYLTSGLSVWKWSESVHHSVVSDSLWPHVLYSPSGSSVHGTLQASILEWAAIPFSRGSSRPREQTWQADSLLSEPPGKSYRGSQCIANATATLAVLWYACLAVVSSTPRLNNKKINVGKLPASLEKCSPLFSFSTLLVK